MELNFLYLEHVGLNSLKLFVISFSTFSGFIYYLSLLVWGKCTTGLIENKYSQKFWGYIVGIAEGYTKNGEYFNVQVLAWHKVGNNIKLSKIKVRSFFGVFDLHPVEATHSHVSIARPCLLLLIALVTLVWGICIDEYLSQLLEIPKLVNVLLAR